VDEAPKRRIFGGVVTAILPARCLPYLGR